MAILRHRACRRFVGIQIPLSRLLTPSIVKRGQNQTEDNNPPPPNLDALGRDAKWTYADYELTELLNTWLPADVVCLLQALV